MAPEIKQKLSEILDIQNWWYYERNGEIPDIGSSSKKKFWFKCPNDHIFELACGGFKNGYRCRECAFDKQRERNAKLTFDKLEGVFDWWDKEKNTIDIKTLRQRSDTLVWFKCNKGHSYQASCKSFYRGFRCSICASKIIKNKPRTTMDKVKDALDWYDNEKNTIPITQAPSSGSKKLWFKCPKGHSFDMMAGHFKLGNRCRYCSGQKPLAGFNTFELVEDALQWWDYTKNTIPIDSITKRSLTKVWMKCPEKGHSFEVSCDNFTAGSRCPECNNKGYSKECIEWLTCIEHKYNIQIQHAEKPSKEFKIPKTRYKADGYAKIRDKQVIFEYHGYRWHGFKGLEKQDELSPYKDKTNAQAYANTIKKENRIKELGYELVVIWSDDYLIQRDNYLEGNFEIEILKN
ncbi:hypothetical protein D5b_00119 [Faustovirus]|nr:hypothetical protein D5b_00119 [Faustovirus]AMN84792.1 hypothetical protein D6_00392 [Faustovirus]AMP44076.1 hypothetical protein PRJ_Dakar_00117 [Faustovirus]